MHSSLCVFPLFEKLFFIKLDNFSTDPQQLSIYQAPWTSFLDRSYHILDLSKFLDFVSIVYRSIKKFYLANRSSTDSRSIKVGFCSIAALQLLDLLRPSYMHYFSHVLHLSIILSSIASYFITFMHLYRFLVPS